MRTKITLAALLLTISGCASTGATLGSGVGDALLERAPYYAGRPTLEQQRAPLGHLPITYQRGASDPVSFEPEEGRVMKRLLADMNAYLDSLGVSARVAAPAAPAQGRLVPPDVRFGCETEHNVPGNDCVERGDSALGRGPQRLVLAVGRPSGEWVTQAAARMQEAGVARTLVITLEIGQYWTRQKGWRGDKSVELGTAYQQSLPWLTSLETPVSVLQLTGAVIGSDGRAQRIGAEGLLARRTRMLASIVGAQELITDEDVERLATLRRDDLPGKPLVWQVALTTLVHQLTAAQ